MNYIGIMAWEVLPSAGLLDAKSARVTSVEGETFEVCVEKAAEQVKRELQEGRVRVTLEVLN